MSFAAICKEDWVCTERKIAIALDLALEQPDGAIYIVHAKIANCEIPTCSAHLQYIDLSTASGYDLLTLSVKQRHTLSDSWECESADGGQTSR